MGTTIEITVDVQGFDVVVKYVYTPEMPDTRWDQGYPEEIEIVAVSMPGSVVDIQDILKDDFMLDVHNAVYDWIHQDDDDYDDFHTVEQQSLT